MELSLIVLTVINFIYVCILPFVFFKGDGTFNLMWCLTASPYVIYPCLIVAGYLGYIDPLFVMTNNPLVTIVLVLFISISIGLISMTVGGHRVPLSLWHQDNDAPVNIVTYGAYKRVRHPFYTSFIICLTCGFIIFPHYSTLIVTIYGYIILNLTAIREEKRLSISDYGEEYQKYMTTTGRFFPKVF